MSDSSADHEFDAESIILKAGQGSPNKIDLAKTALALASIEMPQRSMQRYIHHIEKLSREVGERHKELIQNGADDNAATQLAALKHIFSDKYDYVGDKDHYDHLQNANLVHVIDRRKGMPVALSILCIQIGLDNNWNISALNFPAHVICRIEKDGERLLFDPFNRCNKMEAADLRQYLKTLVGADAELSASYYEASTNRALLIRLQNNIKLRQIEAEDYEAAAQTIERMRKIDPDEYRLLFDAGVLYARLDKPLAALRALENYIEKVTEPGDREEAMYLIDRIREMLN